jgi:SH3 domain protein
MSASHMLKLYLNPFILFSTLVFCINSTNVYADTKYISGVLVVNIRDNYEKPYKYIAKVKTGDQVELLEERNHYVRIKTKDDLEGWIPANSIQTEPPKNETNIKLKEEISLLKKKIEQYSSIQENFSSADSAGQDEKNNYIQSINSLKTENKKLLEENQRFFRLVQDFEKSSQAQNSEKNDSGVLKEKVTTLQNQLDTLTSNSRDIINISKERDTLVNEIGPLRTELTRIKENNQKHEAEKMIYWFFAGAAVFLIGMLSNKIFTRKTKKLSF